MAKNEVCCELFDPKSWDEKTVTWKDKTFVTEKIPLFLHMPLPGAYDKAITKMVSGAESANAKSKGGDYLLLAQDLSAWRGRLYLAVTKSVDTLENITISGTFFTKVYDGPYQDVPKFIKDMSVAVAAKGLKAEDYWLYYTYCPKCAQKYGHNYIVVFAKIS